MSYTKNDWSDIAPAAVKTKLDAIETGLKYVNDERDKETAPGRTLVEAATASAQRTALGLAIAYLLTAAGKDDANALGAAPGASLAARISSILTAAGYTLTPATGANSMDGIADGDTYARTISAVAALLNSSKLPIISGVSNLNTGMDGDCIFTCAGNPTGGPVNLSYSFPTGLQIRQGGASAYRIQIIHENTTESLYIRYEDNGTWPATWRKIWSNFNDGNGGQPPAPKPTAGTPAGGADAPGQFIPAAYFGPGATVYYSGATNKTGTWKATILVITQTNGLVDADFTGMAIGSGTLATVPAGKLYYVYTERQS